MWSPVLPKIKVLALLLLVVGWKADNVAVSNTTVPVQWEAGLGTGQVGHERVSKTDPPFMLQDRPLKQKANVSNADVFPLIFPFVFPLLFPLV